MLNYSIFNNQYSIDTMKLTPVSKEQLTSLREKYSVSLYEPQEMFVEIMVGQANGFLIQEKDKPIGYCILTDDQVLVEFYLEQEHVKNCENIFVFVVEKLNIQSTCCKSFDSLLMRCCLSFYISHNVVGDMFRELNEQVFQKKSGNLKVKLHRRLATLNDLSAVMEINREFFVDEEEAKNYISNKGMFIYKDGDGDISCGIFAETCAGNNAYDIGMLVHPQKQQRGYGTYIITDLIQYCKEKGWQPICGCAYDNEASKKTLEKAGFISRHYLLAFYS